MQNVSSGPYFSLLLYVSLKLVCLDTLNRTVTLIAFFFLQEHVAVLSRNFIQALCMNNTITCLKLEDNRLGESLPKFNYFEFLFLMLPIY